MNKIDPSTLPSFQDSIRRLAFKVFGYEPQTVAVDDAGYRVTVTEPGEEPVVSTVVEFLRDLAQVISDGYDPDLEDAPSAEACPGCGCKPGDGVTPGCTHPDGCGYHA